jgi:hypothetical protein
MPPQLERRFDGHTLAIALDLMRPRMSKKIGGQLDRANQIEFSLDFSYM